MASTSALPESHATNARVRVESQLGLENLRPLIRDRF